MSTPVYVVRNDGRGKRYLAPIGIECGLSHNFKHAIKYTSLEEAKAMAEHADGRNVYRVSYVLRWHSSKTGEVWGYRSETTSCHDVTLRTAERFNTANEARNDIHEWFFDRNPDVHVNHVRVVRVLTKVR